MQTFEQAMAEGQAAYQDVLNALHEAGFPATFTQTGGMNAAIEVRLDGGWALLITDEDDSLPWERGEHQGWGVGIYPPEDRYLHAPHAFESSPGSDPDTLLHLIHTVLRAAVTPP